MKKFALVPIVLAFLALPTMAHAVPVACGQLDDVTDYNTGGGCFVDGLLFSDFLVVNATNVEDPMISAVGSLVIGDTVYFQFNPNLTNLEELQDVHFYFTVTGWTGQEIVGVDLYNGGVGNTAISERLCSQAWILGACFGSSIGDGLLAGSGQFDQEFFDPVNTAYVFKDISSGEDSHLTSFTQSFHVVPEPGTMMLIGTGLVGLARRRMTRKV